MATKKTPRPDQDGAHRRAFDKNKARIYATQTVCGICGKPVDFTQKYPHPLSACIDHIIPIAKGGHPSDIDNLQLAHWCCNRAKSDKILCPQGHKNTIGDDKNTPHCSEPPRDVIANRNLPQSCDWAAYQAN